MPKRCKECSIHLGIFKRKLQCQECQSHFCLPCSNVIKCSEEQHKEKLRINFTRFNCLYCVILSLNAIRKENLFLLSRKHLSEYCGKHNISTSGCREKNDLVDLIMEHAKLNNIICAQDLAAENSHTTHLNYLKENAQSWRSEFTEKQQDGAQDTQQQEQQQQQQQQNEQQEQQQQESESDSAFNSFFPRNFADFNVRQGASESNRDGFGEYKYRNNMGGPSAFSTSYAHTENNQWFDDSEQPPESSAGNHTSPSVPPQTSPSTQPTSSTLNNDNTDESTAEKETSPPQNKARRKWKSMEDLNSEEEIQSLSVLELKQILTANFINYKGCVEKRELIDKVKMLYQSNQTIENDKKVAEEGEGIGEYEKDICKICMDNTIDCVLLDCGHLVSCVKCGKRLHECPICRSLVVRVVHIFRV